MRFLCRKVRDRPGAYVDPGDQMARPVRAWEVHFSPTSSQHDEPVGILDLHLFVMNSCPYQEGKEYELKM
jgi:hypothetical protein